MKFSDDAYDENNDLKLATVFGVLCAIASGVAAIIDSGAAYVFIGILIGNLIALKIDGIHHWITLILFSMQGKTELADLYLTKFSQMSKIDKINIQKWIPIVAVNQLTKEKKEEEEFLRKWIDVVEYE